MILHISDNTFTFTAGEALSQLEPGKWSYRPAISPKEAAEEANNFISWVPEGSFRLREGAVDRIAKAFLDAKDSELTIPSWRVIADTLIPLTHVSVSGGQNSSTALGKIDGLVLPPKAIFSFNRDVGPRTEETGFISGNVLQGNQYVREVGGGICFASTIVHQAVAQTGFDILEHHHHSIRAPYVEPGGDATVYYGVFDYRFRNGDYDLLFEKRETPEALGLRLWQAVE
ncbi:VanW family protein [Heliobacterium chlorum]|uniref:VanW family protein n=1 Tax=Heliobacterium chlorum TaxID=2698 RepID=A0ABR7T1S3_HELCL|nr:VanW family protein [Heliobacterium chlorum]